MSSKISNRPVLIITVVEALLVIGASVVAYFALENNLTLLILTGIGAIAAFIASKFNLWAFGAAAVFGGAVQALFEQEALRFWPLIALFAIGWVFDQIGNWWYDKQNEVEEAPLSVQRNISFAFLPIGVSLVLVYVLMREDFNAVLGEGYESWTDLMLFYAKGALLSPYVWLPLAAAFREINFDVRQVRRFYAQMKRSYGAMFISILIFLPFALGSPFIFGVLFEMFSDNLAIPVDQGPLAAMQFAMFLPGVMGVIAAGWGARWKDQLPVSTALEAVEDEVLEGELVEEDGSEMETPKAETPVAEEAEKDTAPALEAQPEPAQITANAGNEVVDEADTLILNEEEGNEDKLDTLLNTVVLDEEESNISKLKGFFKKIIPTKKDNKPE